MFFDAFMNRLVSLIDTLGYFGILIFMAFESTALPVPSEAVLIPAGWLVAQGTMNGFIVVLMSTLGSIIGSLISYYVGAIVGRSGLEKLISKYGKFVLISHNHLQKADAFFAKHGPITIFIGRFIPVVRHLISLPAGFARMNVLLFTIYTAIGSALWSIILVVLGYQLQSNKELIGTYLTQITIFVLFFCAIGLAMYVLIHRYREKKRLGF